MGGVRRVVWLLVSGVVAGVVGHGAMGLIFYSPPMQALLYMDPVQSEIFLSICQPRNIPTCAAGIILLSILHAVFFAVFQPSIPGRTWFRKGIFWGFTIWALYWLFQEWLLYTMLLGVPILMNIVELSVLLIGSLVEGVMIALFLVWLKPVSLAHPDETIRQHSE
ncbi:MAG: hypothetical protein KJ626_16685 [Verrucomicrobia bacterium]|nr:hypothetical protein [Verrucomicrobiota bacterium]